MPFHALSPTRIRAEDVGVTIAVSVDEGEDRTRLAQVGQPEYSRPIIDVQRRSFLAPLTERDAEVGTPVAVHVCDANRVRPCAAFTLHGESRCRLVVKGAVAVTHRTCSLRPLKSSR